MQVNQKGFSAALILIAILLIMGIGTGAYYFGKSSAPVPPPPPPPSPSATPTISPKTTPTVMPTVTLTPTVNPNSNIFTSQELGVTFNYTNKNTGVNNSKIAAKQIGNKIYVYSTSGPAEEGQYLEMFTKDKNASLIEAIKQKILVGYSLTDCLVKVAQNPVTGQSYPAGYEIANITVPTGPNDGLEEMFEKTKKCPEKYVTTNGISYFLTDANHPDKFIYLSIGQYGIDSGIGDKLWQTTIKFLP